MDFHSASPETGDIVSDIDPGQRPLMAMNRTSVPSQGMEGKVSKAAIECLSTLFRRTGPSRNEKILLRRKRLDMDDLATLLAFGPHAERI
jgi:hypothetical protein